MRVTAGKRGDHGIGLASVLRQPCLTPVADSAAAASGKDESRAMRKASASLAASRRARLTLISRSTLPPARVQRLVRRVCGLRYTWRTGDDFTAGFALTAASFFRNTVKIIVELSR
ncbi:MAG: hypothetical protein HC794_05005 [Nitrospiraceae bacterium]|nr:hypothetical protein [Nitrospiraceae bacterium]